MSPRQQKLKKAVTDLLKEEIDPMGISFRSLLDGEIALALSKMDLSNYQERNKFIDALEDRLIQYDWISLSTGTTFEKTFTPTKKR